MDSEADILSRLPGSIDVLKKLLELGWIELRCYEDEIIDKMDVSQLVDDIERINNERH